MSEEPAPYGTGNVARAAAPLKRIRIPHLQAMKERGERWAMLTAYDQYAAEIFDEAGIPVLLIGDSAANNVYGYETTVPVTVDDLIPLVRAVTRSAKHALVVADLPFGSYQASPTQALGTATRFMKEGLAHAVKLEGGRGGIALPSLVAGLLLPDLPVFLNSPMAADATRIYAAHAAEHRLTLAQCNAMCGAAKIVNSVEESIRLNSIRMPAVIVSASGGSSSSRPARIWCR